MCTFELVAACFNTGQVVGLSAAGGLKGPNVPLGNNPQSLTRLQDVLVVVDGLDRRVRQARLSDYALLPAPETETEAGRADSQPNHVLADDPFLYVVSSGSNTV